MVKLAHVILSPHTCTLCTPLPLVFLCFGWCLSFLSFLLREKCATGHVLYAYQSAYSKKTKKTYGIFFLII